MAESDVPSDTDPVAILRAEADKEKAALQAQLAASTGWWKRRMLHWRMRMLGKATRPARK